jgi:hypothetical protein
MSVNAESRLTKVVSLKDAPDQNRERDPTPGGGCSSGPPPVLLLSAPPISPKISQKFFRSPAADVGWNRSERSDGGG